MVMEFSSVLALGDCLFLVTEREELVLPLLLLSFCYLSMVHTHLVSKAGLELLTLLPLPLECRYYRSLIPCLMKQ